MDFFGILYDMKNGKKMPYSKNYFDTLFAAKLEELGVKTITDTLPIEFTSKGGAIHWTVYGKAPHDDTITGTLPLTFTAKAGAASDWEIYGNDDNGTEQLFDGETIQKGIIYNGVPSYSQDTVSASFENGIITFTTQNSGYRGVYFDFIEIDDTYTVSIKNAVGNGTAYLLIDYYDENKSYISRQSGTVPSSYPHQKSYTPPASTKYVRLSIQNNETGTISVEQLMLVKGSTAPDHYIPYQKGVGERTANEFDKTVNELTNSYNLDGSTGLPISDASRAATLNPISVNSSTYTLTYDTSSENVYNAIYSVLNGNTLVRRVAGLQSGDTLDASGGDTVYICFYSTVVVDVDNISNIMLVRGSTAPDHFIPYGYEIPIRLRGENLFDYTTLTAGYFIDVNGVITANSSWAISDYIPVNANTAYLVTNYSPIANSAYDAVYDVNKNLLGTIKVKSDIDTTFETPQDAKYVRLSIRTAASAQYTVEMFSFNDYTLYIGSTPLRAGQSISKTSTGVDLELFEGENTVSTTLYNKPETSITYTDYLGVGEYVNGQWQIPLTISHITDNLFDKNAHDTANGFIDNKKVYWDGLKQYSTINDNNYFLSEYMPVTAGKGYYPTDIYYYDALKEYYSIFFYTADKQLIDVAYRSHETVTPAPENATYMRVCVAKNKADSAMMTTKPTSEYIPHKQSTDYTIPIDAPLTEGQSVSDTVEITAYEGTNTLDTTLYNKPTMTITYK